MSISSTTNVNLISPHSMLSLSDSKDITTVELNLHDAVQKMDLDQVKTLLNTGKFSINDKDQKAQTPLSIAVNLGDLDFIQSIIELGADLNQKLSCNETALHKAVSQKKFHIVRLLLENAANPNNMGSWSFFNATGTPLHLAIRSNNFLITQLLVQYSADINLKNEWGETPLHIAAYYGSDEIIVNYLVKLGAKINATNTLNTWTASGTPLHVAAEKSNPHVIRALIKNGAYINELNEKGESPIFIAVQKSSLKSFEELLKYRPCLNLTNKKGETLLKVADNQLKEGGGNAQDIFNTLLSI